MSRFTEGLNAQIANEYAASQQYVAVAVYYDAQTLPQLAAHFYRQAVEERNHAMMIVQYLLDAGADLRIPGVEAPRTSFEDTRAPVVLALEQEQTVTKQIADLVQLARDEHEHVGEQFLGWFLDEQREEVASMSALLSTLDRAGVTNLLLVEDYLSRATVSASEPSRPAPAAAGGASSSPVTPCAAPRSRQACSSCRGSGADAGHAAVASPAHRRSPPRQAERVHDSANRSRGGVGVGDRAAGASTAAARSARAAADAALLRADGAAGERIGTQHRVRLRRAQTVGDTEAARPQRRHGPSRSARRGVAERRHDRAEAADDLCIVARNTRRHVPADASRRLPGRDAAADRRSVDTVHRRRNARRGPSVAVQAGYGPCVIAIDV